MTTEDVVLARLRGLPEAERERLLAEVGRLIDEYLASLPDRDRAVAAVQATWASVSLDRETLRWVAEDEALEYELG